MIVPFSEIVWQILLRIGWTILQKFGNHSLSKYKGLKQNAFKNAFTEKMVSFYIVNLVKKDNNFLRVFML
jgi:hypothetical protein